jgi:hypothetical protein
MIIKKKNSSNDFINHTNKFKKIKITYDPLLFAKLEDNAYYLELINHTNEFKKNNTHEYLYYIYTFHARCKMNIDNLME